MKIHPKFASGIFVFCYCGLVILFDKLIKTLEEYNVPVNDIYVYSSIGLPITKVSGKEGIANRSKRDAEYLIQESKLRSKKK